MALSVSRVIVVMTAKTGDRWKKKTTNNKFN